MKLPLRSIWVLLVTLGALGIAQPFDVWSWGANASGQLGDGTTTDRWTPVSTLNLQQVTAVTGGSAHSLALLNNGTVWSWGSNSNGQLGDGTNTDRNTPVQVLGLTNVVAISAGEAHSLALRSDGYVYAWGRNIDGALGDGTTTDRWTATRVVELAGVIEIAAGDNHNVVVFQNGQVFAWGSNTYGQLGDGTTVPKLVPQQVEGLINMVDSAAGEGFTMALRDDGSVFTWGLNNRGQLGDGSTTDNWRPQMIMGLTGVIAMSGGKQHCVVLRNDNHLWAWGANDYGQLGDGTTNQRVEPVPVQNLAGVTRLAELGMADHSLARKSDGTAWVWGLNGNGQLGNNSTSNSSVPVQISGLADVQEIGGDRGHCLAIRGPGKPIGILVPQDPVPGGVKVTGTLVLNDYSDYKRLIRMNDDSSAVLMSTYGVIKPYLRMGTFSIWTYGVANATLATISATFEGVTQTVMLALIPATIDLVWLSPTSVVGGNPSMGNLRLNGMAPSGGLAVTLTTSKPAVANHASSVTVSYGATTKQFPVSTFGVDTVQTAVITGTTGSVSRAASITVRPASLSTLTLSESTVVGGTSVTGTVAMDGKTGPLGRTTRLSSSVPQIVVPASMYVPPQRASWTFGISTQTVTTTTTGTITATQGAISKTATLTLNP